MVYFLCFSESKHAIYSIDLSFLNIQIPTHHLNKNEEWFLQPILYPLDRNVVSSKLASKDEYQDLSQALLIKDGEFENKTKRKRKEKSTTFEM